MEKNIFMRIWYVSKHVLHIFHISAFSCQYWNDTITFGIYFHLLVLNIYFEYQNMDNSYFSVSLVQSLSCPCWDIPKEEQDCPTKEEVRSKYILIRDFTWLLQLGCKYGYTTDACGCCDVSINIHCSTALQADTHLSACIQYNCNEILLIINKITIDMIPILYLL